jgi:formiminotetrahydrofolate cyclodeaminase
MVKREAARYGVLPVGSEIVGLVPGKALEMAADYFLQLENFSPAQVLEHRLAAARAGDPAESAPKEGRLAALARPFFAAVAEASPTPAGGSVSAFAAALAAGLGQMVAGLSRKKKSQAAHAEALSSALDELCRDADALLEAIDRDAASFNAVLAAFKLPQGNQAEQELRKAAVEAAIRGATEVPMQVAEAAVALDERLAELGKISAEAMRSLENVETNLESLADAAYVQSMRARAKSVEARLGHV